MATAATFEFEAPNMRAALAAVGRPLDRAFRMVPDYAPCPFDRARAAASCAIAIKGASPHDTVPLYVRVRISAIPAGDGEFTRAIQIEATSAAMAAREAA